MTKPRSTEVPQEQQDALSKISRLKGINTKTMMKQLARLSNEVPREVPNTNRNFIDMVVIEHDLAHAKTEVQKASNLTQSIESIAPPYAALEQKRDSRLLATDVQDFARFKDDASTMLRERQKLLDQINTYITTSREKFIELGKKLSDKTPLTQKQILPNALRQVGKPVTDLLAQAIKLNTNEDALQKKLDRFLNRVSQIARAAGMVTQPLKPSKPEF